VILEQLCDRERIGAFRVRARGGSLDHRPELVRAAGELEIGFQELDAGPWVNGEHTLGFQDA
jgi:hypothetical protein